MNYIELGLSTQDSHEVRVPNESPRSPHSETPQPEDLKNGYKPLSPSVKSEDHDIIIGQAGQMGMSITPEKRKNNLNNNNNNNNNKLKANNNIIISDDLPTSPIPQYKHMEILTDHNNKDIITQNKNDMCDTMKGQNGYVHTTVVLLL